MITAGDQINLAAWSRSGTCFMLRDNARTGTYFGSATGPAPACVSSLANAVMDPSW